MKEITNYHFKNLNIFILIINSSIDIFYGHGYHLEQMHIYYLIGYTLCNLLNYLYYDFVEIYEY